MQGDEVLRINHIPSNNKSFTQGEAINEAQASSKEICLYICTFVFATMWWIFFGIYVSDSTHFGSESNCVILRNDCIGLVNLFFTLLVLGLIVTVLTIFKNKLGNLMKWFYLLFKMLLGIYSIGVGMYYLVNVTIALTKGEPCEGLRVLAIVWVIFVYSSIAITCCTCCFFCACALLLGSIRNNDLQH